MPYSIKHYFTARFQRFLDRRIPAMRSVTLNQRRIFIFPSKPGIYFLLLLFVMLIAAINYQNNMAFALVFLLSSVFVVSILHTFSNLSGLTISALRSAPVFMGDNVCLELSVAGKKGQQYFDVDFSLDDSEVCSVSLTDNSEQLFNLHVPVSQRGWFRPNRLSVKTFYPVGLIRAWTWLAMDIDVLVYPRPLKSPLEFQASADAKDTGDITPLSGSDEFYEFKQYRDGDSPKHVFWNGYAKDQLLQTKHYVSYRDQHRWLDWDMFNGDVEQRLSKLCYWVLQLEKTNDDYGLRLPGLEIAPAHGIQHQKRLLKELALHQLPSQSL
jgi:uncharacterized protein (DUF58 family)